MEIFLAVYGISIGCTPSVIIGSISLRVSYSGNDTNQFWYPFEAGLVEQLDKYPWSSHKGYLSNAKKWDWLYKNFVFLLFSKDKIEGKTRYKVFVFKENLKEINEILGRRKLPSVLGAEDFVDGIKRKFFHKGYYQEIPESKFLLPDGAKIKEAVCKEYGMDRVDLFASKRGVSNVPRDVTICLLRTLRGDGLEAIGREFNMNR